MRLLALALLLTACATTTEPPKAEQPRSIQSRYICMDTNLFEELLIDGQEYTALVGRCLGDMQIIGRSRETAT